MELSIVSHGNTSHLPFFNLSQKSEHKDITKAQYRAKQVVIAVILNFAIKKKEILNNFATKTAYIEVARRKKREEEGE